MKKYVLNFFDPYVFHIFFFWFFIPFLPIINIVLFPSDIFVNLSNFFAPIHFPFLHCKIIDIILTACQSPPALLLPLFLLFFFLHRKIHQFLMHIFSIKILEGKKGVPAPATTICYRGRWQIVQLLYRNWSVMSKTN